jgi:cellobiose-specific phosphotransferase system component IIC
MSQGGGAVIRALIFLAISVAVSSCIWYPFFKAYEASVLKEEAEKKVEAK